MRFTETLSCLAVGLFAHSASAAIAIAVDPPYSLSTEGGATTVYLASSTALSATVILAPGEGFASWSPSGAGQHLPVHVTGMEAAKTFIKVHALRTGNVKVEVPVFPGLRGTASGILGSGNQAIQIPGLDGYVEIDPVAVCNFSPTILGCNNTGVETAANSNTGITLYFNAYAAGTDAVIDTDATQTTVKYVTKPLDFTCGNPGFFPSDEAILVDTTKFPVTFSGDEMARTARSLLVSASSPDARSVTKSIAWNSGEQTVDGFKNVDPASDPKKPLYQLAYGVVDPAGLTTLSTTGCQQTNVFASDITGVLTESNCFVATASYRDPHAPGVELLRRFRDQFLVNYGAGRVFVKVYGIYGPPAAEWLLRNPEYRVPVLAFLMPIQMIAWAVTEPLAYVAVALTGLFLAFLVRFLIRRRLHRAFLSILIFVVVSSGGRVESSRAAESNQPYIDSLLSTMETPTVTPKPGQPDPYLQEQRRKLGTTESSDGYTERLKRDMEPESDSKGYAEKLKSRVGPEGSAIEDYRKGKKLKANTGDDKVRGVIGFNIGTAMDQTFVDETVSTAYDNVYGPGWVPDVRISYEFKPWTQGALSVVGLYSSAGATFTQGSGKFAYVSPDFDFGSNSRTKFRFITIPVQVGPMIRLPLNRILTPYIGGGPALVGFFETRTDDQDGQHGYSPALWGNIGLNISLNWISKKSAWDSYATSGIKKTSLNLGYHLLTTTGGLLETTTTGIIAGFTFEI